MQKFSRSCGLFCGVRLRDLCKEATEDESRALYQTEHAWQAARFISLGGDSVAGADDNCRLRHLLAPRHAEVAWCGRALLRAPLFRLLSGKDRLCEVKSKPKTHFQIERRIV